MRRACSLLLAAFCVGMLLAGAPSGGVSACSVGVVPGPPPTRDQLRGYAADAFGRADAVFRGRVVAVDDGGEAVTFRADVWWKGTPAANVAVRAVANGCGYWFAQGGEYVVYARATADWTGAALEVTPGTASHSALTTDVEDEVFGPGVPPPTAGGTAPGVGRWFDLLIGGVLGGGGAGAYALRRR